MFAPEFINLSKEVESRYPSLFKQSYPRRIIPPSHEYGNPRLYAGSLASIAILSHTSYNARNHVVGGVDLCAKELIKNKVPTFFIHPELLKAIANTDIAGDFCLNQLKWPLDAMTFCLPYKLSQEIFGVPVPWLSVARLNAGNYQMTPSHSVKFDEDRIAFHYPVFARPDCPTDFGGCWPISEPVQKLFDGKPFIDEYAMSIVGEDNLSVEQDKAISERGMKLTILIILAMISRPEYVEMGGILRKGKTNEKNPSKNQDELWSGNVIGRGYALKKESQEGHAHAGAVTGIASRTHMRRGHFRNHACGPRFDIGGNEILAANRLHKVIWIEPVLVNA